MGEEKSEKEERQTFIYTLFFIHYTLYINLYIILYTLYIIHYNDERRIDA